MKELAKNWQLEMWVVEFFKKNKIENQGSIPILIYLFIFHPHWVSEYIPGLITGRYM
jgi:hypothetical protein